MGILIAIDGLDASGKNTQTKKLYDYLQGLGKDVKMLSFPTYDHEGSMPVEMYLKGQLGSNPKDVNAYAASTFFAVDRYISYKRCWEKDYNDGKIIVSDRYTTANAIHQLMKLPKIAWKDFLSWLWQYEFRQLGLPAPSKVIFLDVSPEFSIKTARERAEKENSGQDIHEVSETYMYECYEAAHFASRNLCWEVIKCDEDGHFRNEEEIFKDILKAVEKIEGLKI